MLLLLWEGGVRAYKAAHFPVPLASLYPWQLQLPSLLHSLRMGRVGELEWRTLDAEVILARTSLLDARPSKAGETPLSTAVSKIAPTSLTTQSSKVYNRV